jgi:hypothetical protein
LLISACVLALLALTARLLLLARSCVLALLPAGITLFLLSHENLLECSSLHLERVTGAAGRKEYGNTRTRLPSAPATP